MPRSLFRQLEQIRGSGLYNDSVPDVNTQNVAEPTVSGSLEHDLNVIRSIFKQIKGTTNWYDSLSVSLSSLTSGGEKYIEETQYLLSAGVEHFLPYSITYTPSSTAGREGKNMDVYLDGQLLAADTGVSGIDANRDYGETSISGITFRFDVQAGRNITYIVRQ